MESRPTGSHRPSRRRAESLFLPVVLAVILGSVWYANRTPEEVASLPLPDFSVLPYLELDVAIELPYQFAPLARPNAPRLVLGRDTEGVIAAVRRGLLESSGREVPDVEELPAVTPEARVAAR